MSGRLQCERVLELEAEFLGVPALKMFSNRRQTAVVPSRGAATANSPWRKPWVIRRRHSIHDCMGPVSEGRKQREYRVEAGAYEETASAFAAPRLDSHPRISHDSRRGL